MHLLQSGMHPKLVFHPNSTCSKIIQTTMSDLLSSVKSSFFNDVQGCKDAESRLEGMEEAYLFRDSDVKTGFFIISHVKNSSVSHLVTPNRNGKFVRQTLEEAVYIAADVLACSDMYRHPVPPPSPGDTASKSSGCSSESDESRCYCLFRAMM